MIYTTDEIYKELKDLLIEEDSPDIIQQKCNELAVRKDKKIVRNRKVLRVLIEQ